MTMGSMDSSSYGGMTLGSSAYGGQQMGGGYGVQSFGPPSTTCALPSGLGAPISGGGDGSADPFCLPQRRYEQPRPR